MKRLLSVLLAVTPLLAQERVRVSLPVHDLVSATSLACRHVFPLHVWDRDKEDLATTLEGELALLGPLPPRIQIPAYCSPDALADVVTLLAALESGDVKPAGGEILADPAAAERAGQALDTVRKHLTPPVTLDLVVEQLDSADKVRTVLVGREVTLNGETRVVSELHERAALVDFEVEIAQASSIACPVTRTARFGASAAFRTRVLPAGDAALFEAVVRVLEPNETPPIDPVHPGFGPIDRLALTGTEAGFALRLEQDVEAQQVWAGLDGRRWRLRARARWTRTPAEAAAPVLQSPLLHSGVLDFRLLEMTEKEAAEQEAESSNLVSELLSTTGQHPQILAVERSEGLAVLADVTPSMPKIRDAIARGLDRANAGVQVELRILDVANGQSPAEDGTLPTGAREVGRVQGRVVRGRFTCFTSYKERSFLEGWGVEVAQSARIPDPHIGRVREGWSVNLRIGTDGRATLESEVRRIDTIEAHNVPLDVEQHMPPQEGVRANNQPPVKGAAVSLPQDVVAIEKPRVTSQLVAATLVLDASGKAIHRRSSARLFGADRDLLVVLQVK